MQYYKDKNTGEVYAYDQSDIDKVNKINSGDTGGIDPVFFKIRDNLANCTLMTDEEIEEHINPTPTTEQLAEQVRAKRDHLINSFIWRINRHRDELDLGLEPTEPLEPLLQHVQALRDVSQQEGFPEVVEWPTEPSSLK